MNVLTALADRLPLIALARSLGSAVLILFGFFLFFYLLERRSGGDTSRYRSASFWHDVVYALFYRGGIYQAIVGTAIASLLGPFAVLRLPIFDGWPLPATAVAFWILSDFLGYWVHRLQHRVRFLWAFHRVHHAPERLTFLTSYRIHPVEQLLTSLVLFVPLLVLGVPQQAWLPLVVVSSVLEFAQHSDLPWRFGRLYSVVVGPVFHAVHHSIDPRHHHSNFGKILGTWDTAFGTLHTPHSRPHVFGLGTRTLPETLASQLVTPFRQLARTGKASGEPATSAH